MRIASPQYCIVLTRIPYAFSRILTRAALLTSFLFASYAQDAQADVIIEFELFGEREVWPGEEYTYDLVMTNLSDGEDADTYVWLDGVEFDPASHPEQGDWSLNLELPNTFPYGPFELPPNAIVLPPPSRDDETTYVKVDELGLYLLRPESRPCTYKTTKTKLELGVFKWPFFFLGYTSVDKTITTHTVPEPATIGLLAMAAPMAFLSHRRRRGSTG